MISIKYCKFYCLVYLFSSICIVFRAVFCKGKTDDVQRSNRRLPADERKARFLSRSQPPGFIRRKRAPQDHRDKRKDSDRGCRSRSRKAEPHRIPRGTQINRNTHDAGGSAGQRKTTESQRKQYIFFLTHKSSPCGQGEQKCCIAATDLCQFSDSIIPDSSADRSDI